MFFCGSYNVDLYHMILIIQRRILILIDYCVLSCFSVVSIFDCSMLHDCVWKLLCSSAFGFDLLLPLLRLLLLV